MQSHAPGCGSVAGKGMTFATTTPSKGIGRRVASALAPQQRGRGGGLDEVWYLPVASYSEEPSPTTKTELIHCGITT